MKFKIVTLGCKVNIYESEMMKQKFLDANFIYTDKNDADVTIINTCSVTNNADSKSRKIIRKEKNNNKNTIIVVCGCMAQNHQDIDKTIDIDILIGTKDKSQIVDIVKKYLEKQIKYKNFYDISNVSFENMEVSKYQNKTRGFVKIQDGCNNFCSYCVIPYLRGNNRSKDFNMALKEIETLVLNGHKEIILTGIHTGNYHDANHDLADLLEKACEIKNLKRLRISSIEVLELTEHFLKILKDNPKICNHLHIPLQSGSDPILKLMNRRYDTKTYKQIIEKVRTIRPLINITTDVIVGFPNETDEDFLNTLNFCKEIGFSKIHVFPYSKRDKTPAALMKQVNDKTKKERVKKLIELSNELENKYYQKFIDKKVDVLIEETKENYSEGLTSNYIKVKVKKKLNRNNIYNVTLTKVDKLDVFGEL